MLASGADRQPLEGEPEPSAGEPVEHDNVRGGRYYGEAPSGGRSQEERRC